MLGIMMTHPIIRETMSLVELLERDDYQLVSNIEFKEIFFLKEKSVAALTLLFIGEVDLIY